MGVVIAATAARPIRASGIEACAQAVASAVAEAGLRPEDVHAVINVGVYRDSNIVEPAVSALISKSAGIGLEYTTGAVPTFSFDLMNGPCGFLNAVQVASSLLTTGSVANVVICAGDTHPSMTPQPYESFPIASIATAVVLVSEDSDAGFGVLQTESISGPVRIEGGVTISAVGTQGRSTVAVTRSDEHSESIRLAVDVTQRALKSRGLDPVQVALIAGAPFPTFGAEIGTAVGIDDVTVPECHGDPHTSALPLAYGGAALARRDLVFVAGGGPTAAAITYRRQLSP